MKTLIREILDGALDTLGVICEIAFRPHNDMPDLIVAELRVRGDDQDYESGFGEDAQEALENLNNNLKLRGF